MAVGVSVPPTSTGAMARSVSPARRNAPLSAPPACNAMRFTPWPPHAGAMLAGSNPTRNAPAFKGQGTGEPAGRHWKSRRPLHARHNGKSRHA